MAYLETYKGKLEVFDVWKDSDGHCWAVTGYGVLRRRWPLREATYKRLKQALAKERSE